MTSPKRSRAGLLAAVAVIPVLLGVDIKSGAMAMVGPPYQNCGEARADGRSSIPNTDPAYRPELDLDGDGVACEPSKSRRSTR